MTKEINIYTDGSSLGNPGKGGWGAILIYNGREKKISGNNKDATNNQMELMAVIQALEEIKMDSFAINVYTDSQYVRNGITKWIFNWIKNDWKSAKKKPIKNKELWQELYELSQKYSINWHWVKAHNGNKYNEIADKLAREAAENC